MFSRGPKCVCVATGQTVKKRLAFDSTTLSSPENSIWERGLKCYSVFNSLPVARWSEFRYRCCFLVLDGQGHDKLVTKHEGIIRKYQSGFC